MKALLQSTHFAPHLSWFVFCYSIWSTVIEASLPEICLANNLKKLKGKSSEDYILYGLTQDCQIFFIRPSQLPLLSTIDVNPHNSYCYPNLVQLHLKSPSSLLLLMRQAGNRICTLEVQIPQSDMLFGDHLFSYSLLSSLPYAACSHAPPNSYSLEPDLSYLDSVFEDIIYFVDALSTGPIWTVHQFQLNEQGYLRHLEKIPINNHAKQKWTGPDMANEYILSLDNQRNYLYKRNRFEASFVYECAYDLMFRPNTVVVHRTNSSENSQQTWLNSIAADDKLLLFTETDRTVQPPVTRLYAKNISSNDDSVCLSYTGFSFDIGVLRDSTLAAMKAKPLPKFDPNRKLTVEPTLYPASTSQSKSGDSSSTRRISAPHLKATSTPRRTTLKATTIHSSTSDSIITSTEFEEIETEEDDEDESEKDLSEEVNSSTVAVQLETDSPSSRGLDESSMGDDEPPTVEPNGAGANNASATTKGAATSVQNYVFLGFVSLYFL